MTADVSTTRAIRLVNVPQLGPGVDDFAIDEVALSAPQAGELAIRALLISVDPYLMMPIRRDEFPDGRIRSRIIAQVEESRAEGFAAGDLVLGFSRWQERDCVLASDFRLLRPVVPLTAYLGLAGHSGFTAMLGMRLLDPQPGQTVVVSSAAGMVGLVACQLAQAAGARVVAVAGGTKAARVAELYGLAAAVDHAAPDFPASLARACPDGIDRYFESVGAKILDPVLALANAEARVAMSGLIQHYANDDPIVLANFRKILLECISILPFSIYHSHAEYPAAHQELEAMVAAGTLHAPETIHHGFERLPEAFLAMLTGNGFGKHMVQVAE